MRRLLWIATLLRLSSPASAEPQADAHAEMAAALVAQADLHPTPVSLPKAAAAPSHAATASAVKRGVGPRAATEGQRAADQVSQQAQAQAQALAHQAQGAASAAAGQAQAATAKERSVTHPHPGR